VIIAPVLSTPKREKGLWLGTGWSYGSQIIHKHVRKAAQDDVAILASGRVSIRPLSAERPRESSTPEVIVNIVFFRV
jgi:hypothetical protein